MIVSLDDVRWQGLRGGYRVPYDPRPALRALAVNFGDERAWAELWNELHHQGDVGEVSYLAIVPLAAFAEAATSRDWNCYALAATIEMERHQGSNPSLPSWVVPSYAEAWTTLVRLALQDLERWTDLETIRAPLAVVALGRGARRLGALLIDIDESEIDDFIRIR